MTDTDTLALFNIQSQQLKETHPHVVFLLTCFESTVRVAGATFTNTGGQSFLSLPSIAASSASLIISIPVKHTQPLDY